MESLKRYKPLAVVLISGAFLLWVAMLATGAKAAGKWNGCHLGAAAGYSISNTKTAIDVPGGNLVTVDGFAGEGLTGSIMAGCDVQMDRLVVGLWSEYSWHDADVKITAGNGALALTSPLNSSWAIGGRAGVLVTYDTLLYGLAGYTRASFGDITLTSPGPNGSLSVGDLKGWIIGGGMETNLPITNMTLDLRYTAALYERNDVTIFGPVVLGFEPVVHTVRAGVTYRFNFDGSGVPSVKP